MQSPYSTFIHVKSPIRNILANQNHRSYSGMRKKYECLIEVKITYGSEHWEEFVSTKMTEAISKLKATVEEVGGKVHIRH